MKIFSLFTSFPIIIFIMVLIFNASSCSAFQTKTSKYLIPKGYVGWVRIYYGIKNASALPVSDDGLTYTHKIQPDGKLITSTVMDFDSYAKFYFYNDEQEIEIPNSSSVAHDLESGSYDIPCVFIEGQSDKDCQGMKTSYVMFYVGTETQYQEAKKKIKDYLEFLKTNISNDLKDYK